MAQFTVQLDAANGPVITVLVGVSLARAEALATAGQQLPPSVPARALVDTGASSTCVDTGILSRLDLRPTGSTSMHTPSTGAAPHVADLYDVSIVVPGAGRITHRW